MNKLNWTKNKVVMLIRLIKTIDYLLLVSMTLILLRADTEAIFSALIFFSPYLLVKSLLYVVKGVNYLPWKY